MLQAELDEMGQQICEAYAIEPEEDVSGQCFLCQEPYATDVYTDAPFGIVESWELCHACGVQVGHSYGLSIWQWKDEVYLECPWHESAAYHAWLDALFYAWCLFIKEKEIHVA